MDDRPFRVAGGRRRLTTTQFHPLVVLVLAGRWAALSSDRPHHVQAATDPFNLRHTTHTSASKSTRQRALQNAFVPQGVQQSQQAAGTSTYPIDAAIWLGEAPWSLWIVGNRFLDNTALPECFATRMTLDGTTPWSLNNTGTLNSSGVWEACTTLSLGVSPEAGTTAAKAIVAGYSQRATLLVNNNPAVPYKGFLADAYPTFGSTLRPLLSNTETSSSLTPVTIPIASGTTGDFMSSAGETTWAVSIDVAQPDAAISDRFVTGIAGSLDAQLVSNLSIHRWNRNKEQQQRGLIQSYSGTWNGMPVSIQPSGMLVLRDGGLLIVAGSTSAQGQTFGTKRFDNGNDLDGFVLKLDGERGQPAGSGADVARIFESVNGQHDRVEAICNNENLDPDFFYALGSTDGSIDGIDDPILLSKVSVDSLERVWTTRLAVNGKAHGMSCTVSRDGAVLYVAGVVYDGASLAAAAQPSYGGNDIFVANADTQSGSWVWVKQIGSSADDAVSTVLTNEDDTGAIIVGHTFGPFYRAKVDNNADLVMFSISRNDGGYLPLTGSISDPSAPVAVSVSSPPTTPVAAPMAAPMTAPAGTPSSVMTPISAPVAAPVDMVMPVVSPTLTPVMEPLSVPTTATSESKMPVSGANAIVTSPAPIMSSPVLMAVRPTSSPLMASNQAQAPSLAPLAVVNASSPTSSSIIVATSGATTLLTLTAVLGLTMW